MSIADDHETAHRMLASEGWRQIAIGFEPEFFAREGLEPPLDADGSLLTFVPEWIAADQLCAILAKLPYDRLLGHDVVLHGTPADLAQQLEPFEQAGLRHVVINDVTPVCDISQMMGTPARIAELARLLGG